MPPTSADILLAARLSPPQVPADLLARPRLLAALDAGLRLPLTLICAPAGFGKTTLAASWLAERMKDEGRRVKSGRSDAAACPSPFILHPSSFSWLSFDTADADPARCMAGLCAAVDRLRPGAAAAAGELLAAGQGATPEALAAALIGGLADLPGDVVLALDDYHLAAGALDALVAALIERGPPRLHILITARDEPGLPLARWRVRGRLAELRGDDLRFRPAEVAALLAAAGLGTDAAARIERRTEGWAAALQLATLALRAGGSGDLIPAGRHLFDFLAEEVLAREPESRRAFLLATGILDRMCPELCDALLKDEGRRVKVEDSAAGSGRAPDLILHPSSFILQQLERANLFISRADPAGQWYRYHPLFAAFLQAQLRPAEAAALHRRAAGWFAERAIWPDAVRHGLAGGDMALAAALIARAVDWALAEGAISTMRAWLDALPGDLVLTNYRLALARAWAHFLQGEHEPAARFVAVAAAIGAPADDNTGGLEMLLAFLSLGQRDLEGAQRHARLALALLGDGMPAQRSLLLINLAQAQWMAGEPDALANGREALRLSLLAGNRFITASVRDLLMQLLLGAGRRREAIQLCEAVLSDPAGRPGALIGLALAHYEANDLAAALAAIDEGQALSRESGIGTGELTVGLVRPLILSALGRADEALAAAYGLRQALPAQLAQFVEMLEVLIHLRRGDLAAVERWAATAALDLARPDLDLDDCYLALAKLHTARGRPKLAREVLAPLEAALRYARRDARLAALLAVRALVDTALLDAPAARAALEEAIMIAAPDELRRALLDAGPDLAPLLPAVRGRAPAFVDSLLAALGCAQPRAPADSGPPLPLSEREAELLALAAAGLSNPEIAARLVISVGTVKTHFHNIYEKLGVRNRVEAIALIRR